MNDADRLAAGCTTSLCTTRSPLEAGLLQSACDTMRSLALLSLTLWSGLFSLHAFTRLGTSNRLAVLHSSPPIETYDSLLDVESIRLVDEELRVGGLGHTLYCRLSRGPCSMAELAIDAILRLRQDESPFVEYWWRQEWLNLEAHRDLDENLWKQSQTHCTPKHAHVLYLSVGEEVRGPTVLLHDSDSGEQTADAAASAAESAAEAQQPLQQGQFEAITVVPAVSGRLLRFDGHMMHAVCRPPLAYLDPAEGGSNVFLWTRVRPNPNNPADPELHQLRRSVLLFNTWDSAPVDLTQEVSAATQAVHATRSGGQKAALTAARLAPRFQALPVRTIAHGDGDSERQGVGVRLKIGLLGDQGRRERASRYLDVLSASCGSEVRAAFESAVGGPATFRIRDNLP